MVFVFRELYCLRSCPFLWVKLWPVHIISGSVWSCSSEISSEWLNDAEVRRWRGPLQKLQFRRSFSVLLADCKRAVLWHLRSNDFLLKTRPWGLFFPYCASSSSSIVAEIIVGLPVCGLVSNEPAIFQPNSRNYSFNYWFITLENELEWRLLLQREACIRPQMSNQWFSIFKTVILDSRWNILCRFLTVREVCSQSITVKLQHLKKKPSRETRWESSTLCFIFYQIHRQQLIIQPEIVWLFPLFSILKNLIDKY